jgi:3-keto-disaccharide hydrolase
MIHLTVWRWSALAALGGAGVGLLGVSLAAQTPASPPENAVSPPAAMPTTPARGPGAIVLFSGKPEDLQNHWIGRYSHRPAAWKIQDGALVAGRGDIATRQEYQDFFLHVEFKEPSMPNAHGQERGNSGIGLHGRYEIQVLDSYGIADPGSGDCGAVYSQAAPLFNACKPPLQWQSYDIVFRAPRFDHAGKVVENPRVSVLQNGIVVQNNQEIKGMTGIQNDQYQEMAPAGPIVLQDHGTPVQFRNVWVLPLPPHGARHY